MAGIGWTELIVVILVALLLLGGKRIGRSVGASPGPLPVIGLGIAGGIVEGARLLATSAVLRAQPPESLLRISAPSMLAGALVWMLFGAALRAYWRSNPSRNLPITTIIVWLLKTPVSLLIGFIFATASGNATRASIAYYTRPATWVQHIAMLPSTWPALATAFLLVLCASLATRQTIAKNSQSAANWSGYGGVSMDSQTNHTTRFLCASAYLKSTGFCQRILHHYENETRATAPEVGLDMPLLIGVCRAALKRHLGYHLVFAALAIGGGIAVAASESPAVIAVYVLAAAALFFAKSYQERYKFTGSFRQGAFDPERLRKSLHLAEQGYMEDALPSEEQNLVVYSGFVPFVGAGADLGGWSFSVAVDKPRESLGSRAEPQPFRTPQLYAAIRTAVTNMGIDGLDVRDMCFVHGSDIREDREILPDEFGRPVQSVSAQRISRYSEASDSRVRHYQWIRVRDWGNDLVVSYFLRCAIRGQSLFVEIKRFLLTPLADQYRTIDSLGGANWRSTTALLTGSLIAGPLYPIYSFVALTGKLLRGLNEFFDSEGRERRRQIRDSPLYNYGTDTALRQQLSSNRYVHYFQKLDGDFYSKVLERTILDEIVSFLDEHDIDTSDIRERQTTILNSGIIVQGGDVNAEALAVGTGSNARTGQPRRERTILRKGASA